MNEIYKEIWEVEGSDSVPLLCAKETSPGALCPHA